MRRGVKRESHTVVESAADDASLVSVWGRTGGGTHDKCLSVGEQETAELRVVVGQR